MKLVIFIPLQRAEIEELDDDEEEIKNVDTENYPDPGGSPPMPVLRRVCRNQNPNP